MASRPGVPGSNPIAAPKSYEVYPSTSGLLSFKKPETVLWTIAKYYYYYLLFVAKVTALWENPDDGESTYINNSSNYHITVQKTVTKKV